jgi:hypothetical protein
VKLDELVHGLDLSKPTAGYVRTPGLHMSGIYNSLYAEMYPDIYGMDDINSPTPQTRMTLGTAFEETLEQALVTRIIGERPGEFATQHAADCIHSRTSVKVGDATCPCGAGVIYSPDQLIFNGHIQLGEFKCTWYSIRQGITDPKFDKWFTQMKAYCYHLQTTSARLYVLFVNGDYSWKKPYGGPHVRAWDIEFSPMELEKNWRMLLRHAIKKGML